MKNYLDENEMAVFALFEKNIRKINPLKVKYEKTKISSSIVLTFCFLTTIPELEMTSPIELSSDIQFSENTITKYYRKIIFPNKDEVIPKQNVWPRRKSLAILKPF